MATELHVWLSDIKHNKLLQSPVSQHTGDALNISQLKFKICLRQLAVTAYAVTVYTNYSMDKMRL